MNRAALAEAVAKNLGRGCSKAAADRAVGAVIQAVARALRRGQKVTLVGFGTFVVRRRRAREGRDPRNAAVIRIPAGKTVAFRASPVLKKSL